MFPTQFRRSGQTHSLTQAAGVGAEESNPKTRMLAIAQGALQWKRPLALVLTQGMTLESHTSYGGITHLIWRQDNSPAGNDQFLSLKRA